MGEWQDTIQPGCQGARPCQTILIRTGDIGSDELGSHLINSDLNVLAVNIRGIMYHGRSEQDHLQIIKHKVSQRQRPLIPTPQQPILRVLGLSAPLKLLLDPLVRKLESS